MFAVLRKTEPLGFTLAYGGFIWAIVGGWVLWDRRYRRKWRARRASSWPKVDGRFDEGEIVTMMRGRSKTVAGYEVWLGYEYEAEGEQAGVFRLPEARDRTEAERLLRLLANQRVPVRVCPGKPDKSRVIDEDIQFLIQ